jgi:energy-coupling factor transporter ATP-binding protein EcfA2
MTIVIENLSYAYPDADWALQEVSLRIERGEFLSIMGTNGAGKTTLCLALNGIAPQATGGRIRGTVTVNGLDTKKHPVATLALQVGMIFQNPETQLFSTNVEAEVAFGLENMGVPRLEMQERVNWALELLEIDQLRQRSPAQLSGGERQRLAIASVMAMSPRILVLDEPSANLDPAGKSELLTTLHELKRTAELTVIMAEHDTELIAEFSDRIAVLDAGQLVQIGTPERLFSDTTAMQARGLGVPQVSEIAACLNSTHDLGLSLTRYQETQQVLKALQNPE